MIDKASLLALAALPQATVTIPGKGDVQVRGLSRGEVIEVFNLKGLDADALALSYGLVEPAVSVDEAKGWAGGAMADEVAPVTERIMELSGLSGEGARFRNG